MNKAREKESKIIYVHTNFGQVVDVYGKRAVVVSFEGDGAKCYYEDGGFDYINRDDLENEQIKIIKFNKIQQNG